MNGTINSVGRDRGTIGLRLGSCNGANGSAAHLNIHRTLWFHKKLIIYEISPNHLMFLRMICYTFHGRFMTIHWKYETIELRRLWYFINPFGEGVERWAFTLCGNHWSHILTYSRWTPSGVQRTLHLMWVNGTLAPKRVIEHEKGSWTVRRPRSEHLWNYVK